jgi:hypothetical protein
VPSIQVWRNQNTKKCPKSVFDTTFLHSQMAVDFILGKPSLAHVQATP